MSLLIAKARPGSSLGTTGDITSNLILFYNEILLELPDNIQYNVNRMILTEGKNTDDVLQYLIAEGIIDEQ